MFYHPKIPFQNGYKLLVKRKNESQCQSWDYLKSVPEGILIYAWPQLLHCYTR
uniref:Putative mitochondrial protein AtMg00810-like n=1 Tax=Rhizophora mucronata TaxID=61149 RepID=A0A2P2ILH5_RHIMU